MAPVRSLPILGDSFTGMEQYILRRITKEGYSEPHFPADVRQSKLQA